MFPSGLRWKSFDRVLIFPLKNGTFINLKHKYLYVTTTYESFLSWKSFDQVLIALLKRSVALSTYPLLPRFCQLLNMCKWYLHNCNAVNRLRYRPNWQDAEIVQQPVGQLPLNHASREETK
jgi:hypothetical protein